MDFPLDTVNLLPSDSDFKYFIKSGLIVDKSLNPTNTSENPRIELIIYPVDYIGVFDNASQLEEFESRCIGCNRYKRNCSLLKKAKEGRIQSEIQDGICEKYKG